MGRRYKFDEVVEFYRSQSCKLLEVEYLGSKFKMKYLCICGEEHTSNFEKFKAGGRCVKCGIKKRAANNPRKLKIEEVRLIFEKDKCFLLSDTYTNSNQVLGFICSCGRSDSIKYEAFKRGGRCKECGIKKKSKSLRFTLDEVKNYFLKQGCILLDDHYLSQDTKLNFICSCGEKGIASLHKFKRGLRCKKCASEGKGSNLKQTFEFVKEYFKEQGCELLETDYKNAKETLRYICICGNPSKINFDNFKNKGKRCSYCKIIANSADNHWNWKGGLAELRFYFRSHIQEWKKDTMKFHDYQCVISRSKDFEIHHLYPFNKIIKETLKYLNLPIYQTIGEYSIDEISHIKMTFLKIHSSYGLGVLLERMLHYEFHSTYGKEDFYPEDFYEFKKDILKEFKKQEKLLYG